MKSINSLNISYKASYEMSMNCSVKYKSIYESNLCHIEEIESEYTKYARALELYKYKTHDSFDKELMKKLYEDQFVKKEPPRTQLYLKILNNVEGGTCPVCRTGLISTLDHFLPKAIFPCLSVLPVNLYPCCRWCNSEKDVYVANNKDEQLLHPYFDKGCSLDWFVGELVSVDPISFKVKVNDKLIGSDIYKRLTKQLSVYSLDKMYSSKLVQMYNDRENYLRKVFNYGGKASLVKELSTSLKDSLNKNLGILEVAFYNSLLLNTNFTTGAYF